MTEAKACCHTKVTTAGYSKSFQRLDLWTTHIFINHIVTQNTRRDDITAAHPRRHVYFSYPRRIALVPMLIHPKHYARIHYNRSTIAGVRSLLRRHI
jgi:hypothetical protein